MLCKNNAVRFSCVALIALLVPTISHAQLFGNPHKHNLGPSGSHVFLGQSNSVAIADVNGDGKTDMVVAIGQVGVFLGAGRGVGGFSKIKNYDAKISANAITVGDLNGDGKPDVVAADTSGSMSVLLGAGDGTFPTAQVYGTGLAVGSISSAMADVNGDQKLDVVVAAYNGSVAVLLGNGDGTFPAPSIYNTGAWGTQSAAIADINGDGKPDLVLAYRCSDNGCTEGGVAVLSGNGDGTFQPAKAFLSGAAGASSVAVADVNGDGKPDLVVSNRCSGCPNGGVVGVLIGNGDGTFQDVQTFPAAGFQSSAVLAVDVNGDGNADVIVGECSTSPDCTDRFHQLGQIAVFLGNGDGTFQPVRTFFSGGMRTMFIAVGDLNKDGKLDLAVADNCKTHGCPADALAILFNSRR